MKHSQSSFNVLSSKGSRERSLEAPPTLLPEAAPAANCSSSTHSNLEAAFTFALSQKLPRRGELEILCI